MKKILLSLLLTVALLSACTQNENNTAAPIVNQDAVPINATEGDPATSEPDTSIPDASEPATSGYRVENEHVFTHKFEGIGEATVTPVTKYGITEQFPVSLILSVSDENREIILTPDREAAYPMFSSFEAISFRDLDHSGESAGFTDIIVIANFITGVGKDGANPFSDIFIFKNDGKGGFIEDVQLETSIIDRAGSRTLTVKQVLDLVESASAVHSTFLDLSSFIGTYNLVDSSKYKYSELIIKQVKDNHFRFDLDAYVVRGGEEGLEKGNVNIGTLLDVQATIDGNSAIYKDDMGFLMTFEFAADGTFIITEEGESPFGYGVSASGQYVR